MESKPDLRALVRNAGEDTFHEAANIFPLMESDAFASLVDDIREHGQREPIAYFEGKVIDGRNRFLACAHLKQSVEWVELGSSQIGHDPVAYVVSQNLHRRHLDASQRSMVAGRVKEHYARQAKQRQRLSEGRGKKGVEKLPHLNEASGKARDQAGDAVGVSGKSVDAASKVIANGTKALVTAVDKGDIAVSRAARIAELPKREQSAALEKAKQPREKPQYPVSKAYLAALENIVKVLNGIKSDYGSFAAMTEDEGWDKSETGYAQQLIVALHKSLGELKKEIRNG